MTPNKFYNNIQDGKTAVGHLNNDLKPKGKFYKVDNSTEVIELKNFSYQTVVDFILNNLSFLNSREYYFYGTKFKDKIYLSIYSKLPAKREEYLSITL